MARMAWLCCFPEDTPFSLAGIVCVCFESGHVVLRSIPTARLLLSLSFFCGPVFMLQTLVPVLHPDFGDVVRFGHSIVQDEGEYTLKRGVFGR